MNPSAPLLPVLEATGEYSLTLPDIGDGRKRQVFRAHSLEQLVSKLAAAQVNASEHLSELRSDLRTLRSRFERVRTAAETLASVLAARTIKK